MRDAQQSAVGKAFQLMELQKEIDGFARLSLWMKAVAGLIVAVNLLCARKGDTLVPLVSLPAILLFFGADVFFQRQRGRCEARVLEIGLPEDEPKEPAAPVRLKPSVLYYAAVAAILVLWLLRIR